MFTLMNHREIEHDSSQIWGELCINRDAATEAMFEADSAPARLMCWLSGMGAQVYTDELLLDYGYDCLRMYLMFEKTPRAGDADLDTWEECALEGIYKFLGKYRRLLLVLHESPDFTETQLSDALATAAQMREEMLHYMNRDNTMPNRHNTIAAMMTGINTIQKQLQIGALLSAMHSHDIETAVPHTVTSYESQDNVDTAEPVTPRNPQTVELSRRLTILLAPFAPYLAQNLWRGEGSPFVSF